MPKSKSNRPYEFKITLGKDVNGKLIRKSFYSSKSRTDAKRKAEKFKAQYELELLCGAKRSVQKSYLRPGPSNAWSSTKSHM